MATVEFVHVTKRFDNSPPALNDLHLSVKDGEFLVLVGPSGCGKSTTLRILAGLESATVGELYIGGREVSGLSPQQRNTAMVFQNYALYPHMSVRANLAFPLKMAKTPKDKLDQRVNEAAQLLGLQPLLDRKPLELSGGQRQRVAMGRAIVRNPEVFLMDEPLSNLDAKLRVQIRADIAALQQRMGITTLYVTHDQVEAMTLGHRVAVLDEGRLQQLAEPQRLYDDPANLFVAKFIGSPGMNVFPCRLERHGDKLSLAVGDTRFSLGKSPRWQHLLEGEPAYAGVRPEQLTLADPQAGGLQGRVTGVEALGHEKLVYLQGTWEGEPLVVRTGNQMDAVIDTRVGCAFELDALCIFDQQGQRLA